VKISNLIEKHFWLILIAGILLGLWSSFSFKAPHFLPKLLHGSLFFLRVPIRPDKNLTGARFYHNRAAVLF
jgi:hypothetical protein